MLRRNLDTSQTIFARVTGALPSAVAILKIAGPDAFAVAARLFDPPLRRERAMVKGAVRDLDGALLDEALALCFVAPHSHTGEDTVELHLHGSEPIVHGVENVLTALGARPAERGEFTYRALLNDKLSAAEVERLGDVFLARQPSDLTRIYARRDGALQAEIDSLRSQLIRLQAVLDTAVDFSEEYSAVIHEATQPLEAVSRGCSAIIQRYSAFKSGQHVPRLVLAGRPNAGKSSLFNALLCRYRAIVHEDPGTTRDVIEEDVEIAGTRWKLVDTAGIRVASTVTEREGISLGENFLAGASFWVLVVDGTEGLEPDDSRLLEQFAGRPHLIAWNKRDLPEWKEPPQCLVGQTVVRVSAKEGESLGPLWTALRAGLERVGGDDRGPLPTATQCVRLETVLTELVDFRTALERGVPPEVLAETNRRILGKLTDVVGVVETEEVLDRVFSDFCIGK